MADKLGMSGDAASAYAKDVVAADFEEAGDGVVRKVTGDLDAKGIAIAEAQLRAKMDELMAQAIAQVKGGEVDRISGRANTNGTCREHSPFTPLFASLLPSPAHPSLKPYSGTSKASPAKVVTSFHPPLTGRGATPP